MRTISLLVYTLGALTFGILIAFYWAGRRLRSTARNRVALPAFTLACAAAFLTSLANQVALFEGAGLIMIRNLAAGLVPPLLLHLVDENESSRWRRMVVAFYAVCVLTGLARGLNETGWLLTPGGEMLFRAPALLLGVGALLGIAVILASRRPLKPGERSYRRWTVGVLALLVTPAVVTGAGFVVGQLSDYLLLVFLFVSLYYRERLVFIDLLVKGGVFVAIGAVVGATGYLWWQEGLEEGVVYALTACFLAMWLAGPWVYSRVARLVDRWWLKRRFSPTDAERQFLSDIQAASSEDELRECATRSLGVIFRAQARVEFGKPAAPVGPPDDLEVTPELEHGGATLGRLTLTERADGIPFLSDDRRLLQSLAGTLSLALENVRIRAERRRQEEREQQLRLLASRAELKALRAQINPHFLFNALSVIAGLIHCQPELADETIEHLAEVFRYTLRKSESEWAPLGEEVEFAAAYLRIEQARFGERLSVEFAVDPEVTQIPIPAMSVQPLIENAVKHGVATREGPGRVGLRAAFQDDALRLEVIDSGPGFPPGFALDGNGDSHGLKNVADRLRGYYGACAGLEWRNEPDGTHVVITVPRAAVVAQHALARARE